MNETTELNELNETTAKDCSEAPETPENTVCDETQELRHALLEANIRVALLVEGAAKDRLSEAARLAEGLCAAGAEPAQAAHEVMECYPHLRTVKREMPQFSAQSGGSTDGFSMIRSIFARK